MQTNSVAMLLKASPLIHCTVWSKKMKMLFSYSLTMWFRRRCIEVLQHIMQKIRPQGLTWYNSEKVKQQNPDTGGRDTLSVTY